MRSRDKPLAFASRTVEELADADEYYRARSIRVADRLVRELERNYTLIRKFPYLFGRVTRHYRAAPVRGFPYLIIYRVRRERIEIVSIHHGRKAKMVTG